MKIGYVHPFPLNFGGGEVRIKYLAQGLYDRGHDVSIIVQKYHDRFKPKKQSYEIVEVGQSLSEIKPVMIAPFMLNAFRKLKDYDIIDITHPYSNVISRFFKMSNMNNKSTKIVCTVQYMPKLKNFFRAKSSFSPFSLFLGRLNLFLPYDAIITVSESTKNDIIKTGINPDLISVIRNGIDLDVYKSVKIEKKHTRQTLVCMSRLDPIKRLDTLVDILFSLKHNPDDLKQDVQLIIMGEGPDRPRIEKKILELGLERDVTLTGYVNGEEKVRILKSSHVFVFPSEQESFGIAPLEGMASDLPVVANDIPSLREVLGNAAFFANSPQEFSEKISELLKNRDLYSQYSKKSENKAQEYTWEECILRTERLYDDLLIN